MLPEEQVEHHHLHGRPLHSHRQTTTNLHQPLTMPTAIPPSAPPDSTLVSSTTIAADAVNSEDELRRAIADCSAQVWEGYCTLRSQENCSSTPRTQSSPRIIRIYFAVYRVGRLSKSSIWYGFDDLVRFL